MKILKRLFWIIVLAIGFIVVLFIGFFIGITKGFGKADELITGPFIMFFYNKLK